MNAIGYAILVFLFIAGISFSDLKVGRVEFTGSRNLTPAIILAIATLLIMWR